MKNVFFDSKLTTIEEAKIPINSLAFTLGASVFEAVRVFYRKNNDDYILLNVKKHVERLFQSMKLMRMYPSFNKNDVVHGIEQLISECNTKNNGYIRITAYVNSPSPGSSVYDPKNVTTMFCITYMEKGQLPEYLEGIHCCTSSWTRISDNVLPPRAKSACNYENTRLAGFEAL
ncbi:aminotransferase class IV [Paenibacillus pini]|uniref:aminotransferase class IV n=1 Tax=Paenibacillus pini TaxID=669461 RepID=UPI00068C4542|nr:aminotransferase class IV [Paenibacillus pini]